ncbi:MAG: RNA-binding protein [Thermocaproicibacter melissae]|jgi:ribosomal protein L14E/L6E/L27E|uniref:KOW domain-containing RNA-binding protein n=1 Tax=Thermocaproicibacter melissae TaxID=2966552 RepID=UPI0024B12F07|nr:KOW domain-containing RNA-binding protein [Thermocaproicibacter melissae]WBY64221.1 KOW domain-containing RNA-binding protein [Thermocaproicibacter melissae]
MEFERGRVVRSRAGRDGNGFFVVLRSEGRSAVICDGRRRKLEHPKRKNLKHLAATGTVLSEDQMKTNREIRRALAQFQSKEPLSR